MLFLVKKTGCDHSQYFIELSVSYFFLSSVRGMLPYALRHTMDQVLKTVTVIYYTVSYSSMIFFVFVNLMITYDCHYYYHCYLNQLIRTMLFTILQTLSLVGVAFVI